MQVKVYKRKAVMWQFAISSGLPYFIKKKVAFFAEFGTINK